MDKKLELLDILAEFANQNYELSILNNDKYAKIRNEIIKLQEEIKTLNLSDEQCQTIKRLLKYNSELYTVYMEMIYKQGMIDCAQLLKELNVIH